MGQSKKIIISENNFREWLASTGNLFPGNKLELYRLEKLYADFQYTLNEDCVDPFKIISGEFKPQRIDNGIKINDNSEEFRLAARNLGNIPEHIMKKLKKNQNGFDSKEKGSSGKKD
jgi:hypothetical protein